jgi:chromosome segregation ATPase
MWAGTSALKNIDQSLQTLRNDVVRLDAQLNELTNNLASDQRHRAKLINEIAGVRLAEIESGELNTDYTATDQQVSVLLEQRQNVIAELDVEIDNINTRILKFETQRSSLLETVNHTSKKIVSLEGEVQQQLASNESYLAQLKQAQAAESIAEQALQKMQRAKQNMAEKAKPYQADKLFMYLWGRGYGTTAYVGSLFTRFLDAWVARLIEYEPARLNYWNLVEIPKRLQEHAERVGEQADAQHSVLQELESTALEIAGASALEEKLQSLRDGLDSHDDDIELIESELNDHLGQRARFTTGDDDYIKQCLSKISTSLAHQNLNSIHLYVAETSSVSDDRLVVELQTLEDRLDGIHGDLADVRSLHGGRLDKLRDLEKVRRDFKNSRFDDVRSGFDNKAMISSILGQFLQGIASGSDVWRVIKRNQQYRKLASAPEFGSGGLGEIADILGDEIMRQGRRQRRSRRGSTWHWPKPRRGGGGFNMPRGGGRSSGGGFKTGGGF